MPEDFNTWESPGAGWSWSWVLWLILQPFNILRLNWQVNVSNQVPIFQSRVPLTNLRAAVNATNLFAAFHTIVTGHLTSSGAASTPLTQRPASLTCQSHLTHDYLRSLYVTNSLHRMLLLIDSACAFSSNEAALSSRLSCYLLSLCALQPPTVRIMSCITPLCDTTPVLFSDCVEGFLFLIRLPFTLIVVNPSDYTTSTYIILNVVPIKRIKMELNVIA